MNHHWLRDRVQRKEFDIYWEPGSHNLGDNPTKHHTGTYHKTVRPVFLHVEGESPETVQGCVNIMKKTGKKPIKDNTQSQALRVKGILQSGSKWSNRSSKSNNGYHVTWGKNTIVGRKHTTLLSSFRDRLCALANAPIT